MSQLIRGVLRVGARVALASVLVLSFARLAGSETLRIVNGPADILQWRGDNAGVMTTLDNGTVLEVLDHDEGWYWVALPRDEFGRRRVGWIPAGFVEVVSGEPVSLETSEPESAPLRPVIRQPTPPQRAKSLTTRWRLGATGGLTVGSNAADPFGSLPTLEIFSFLGERQMRHDAFLVVEGGRLGNLSPVALQDRGNAAAASYRSLVAVVTGQRVATSHSSSMEGYYGTAGGKLFLGMSEKAQPYVAGSAGVIRLRPEVLVFANGSDVTKQAISVGVLTEPANETRFLSDFGGGVMLPVFRSVNLDAGYRFSTISVEPRINLHRIVIGLDYGF